MSKKSENKKLVKEFPFLLPRNVFTDEVIEGYDYLYTKLDDMPGGWRKAFGLQMCKEIKDELVSFNYLDDYRITEIKEKYGALRWYDNGTPVEYEDEVTEFKIAKSDIVPIHHPLGYYTYWDHSDDEFNYYVSKKIKRKSQIPNIISKYEKLSACTCIICGNKALYESKGWISPFCSECAYKSLDNYNKNTLKYAKTHNLDPELKEITDLFSPIVESIYQTLTSEELQEIFDENYTV